MTDFFPTTMLGDIVTDPRFAAAAAIAIFSGIVRGFSGFGSALIYIPLMSAVYEPRVAAVTFVMMDCATGFGFLFGVWRQAVWREVFLLAIPAIFAAQFGTLILQYSDPVVLRWVICALVGGIVTILASGWRYQGRPHTAVTVAVGLLAGTLGGAVQISGPPVIIYWLGSMQDVAIVRANLISYFGLFSFGSVMTYWIHGLITLKMIALAAMLGPLHVVSMWAGSKIFHLAPAQSYRRVAYVIIALSAIAAMPLWDTYLR